MGFEWDPRKNTENVEKHGVGFEEARLAFLDSRRIVIDDVRHSTAREKRYLLLGLVGGRVLTVRFTTRGKNIRIFGAGYWRMGKELYEKTHE
jgi:uncharacterized DUF497 family protein